MDLHLLPGAGSDRTIFFGDGHFVSVGEYFGRDDDLLLKTSYSSPVRVDATDIRPIGSSSEQWEDLYLSGKIYVDGSGI